MWLMLVLTIFAGGCGGRSGVLPSGGGADGGAATPDMGGPSLCQQVSGTCRASCPTSAPELVYPDIKQSCGGLRCCAAQCKKPAWICTSTAQCSAGQICSLEIGSCETDPCCPMCQHCVGRCVKHSFFARVLSASAHADLMPAVRPDFADAEVTLQLQNKGSAAVAGIKIAEGGVYIVPGKAAKVIDMKWKPQGSFSGSLAPGQTSKVLFEGTSYQPPGRSAMVPCGKQVQVRLKVAQDKGAAVWASSTAFKLQCSH